jgi:hypothetical protein
MEHRHFCSETSQLAMNYISAPLRSLYRTMEIKNRVSFNILHATFEDPKNIDMAVNNWRISMPSYSWLLG